MDRNRGNRGRGSFVSSSGNHFSHNFSNNERSINDSNSIKSNDWSRSESLNSKGYASINNQQGNWVQFKSSKFSQLLIAFFFQE